MAKEKEAPKEVSRREFVKGAAVGAAAAVGAGALASCAAPTPEVIKETVEVPVEVEVTRVVEKEVEVPAEEAVYDALDPVGIADIEPTALSPRLDTLEGKTIGLGWNLKTSGDVFDDELEALMKDRVKDITIIRFSGYGVPRTVKEMEAIIFGVGD